MEFPDLEQAMPALFIGHGIPLNAIEDNLFSRAWSELGRSLPRPVAVLCVSAHWETSGTRLTAMARPPTIHDFYGFPKALYDLQYPAPGCPDLARMIERSLASARLRAVDEWGLDHGAWSVLARLFPQADVPVVQLSLDALKTPRQHYEFARRLRPLRRKGILILGSGNIVHNLAEVTLEDTAYDWAARFDGAVAAAIGGGNPDDLVHYRNLDDAADQAVPSAEHYLPLLYTVAQRLDGEAPRFFTERVTLGSISMRSVAFGLP